MYELVYAGTDAEKAIHAKFPTAIIADASDDIHTERFEVHIEDVSEDEFYPFAIKEGFVMYCLKFRVMTYGKEDLNRIKKWINIAKQSEVPVCSECEQKEE